MSVSLALDSPTASQVVEALDSGRTVTLMIGRPPTELVFVKYGDRYRCDVPSRDRTYRDSTELKRFLERLQLAEPG